MSTTTAFKSAQTAAAEARYEVADREHTTLMGQLLSLDARHDRAWTDWGRQRILRRGQELLTAYDAARHEYRVAYRHLLLCRWADAGEVSRRAWAQVAAAQDAGEPAASIAPMIEAAEAAVDAMGEAQRAVERWQL